MEHARQEGQPIFNPENTKNKAKEQYHFTQPTQNTIFNYSKRVRE